MLRGELGGVKCGDWFEVSNGLGFAALGDMKGFFRKKGIASIRSRQCI